MNNANDRETAKAFIRKHFIKADTKVCTMSSYRLKHELQYGTNVYLTEQDFVKLMEELGYTKTNRGNWKMRLSTELAKHIRNREMGIW
jgi:hypothetical protein